MLHKYDLNGYAYDDDDFNAADDDDQDNEHDPVGLIIAAIQKHQAKKTARLSKNNIFDPMGVVMHDYINLAGVQAKSSKLIVTSLSNKSKPDPKTLSNMTELLQTNGIKTIAHVFEATFDRHQRCIGSDAWKQKH